MSTELNVTESRLSILSPVKGLVIYNSLVGTVNEELSRRTGPKDQSLVFCPVLFFHRIQYYVSSNNFTL